MRDYEASGPVGMTPAAPAEEVGEETGMDDAGGGLETEDGSEAGNS